MAPLVSGCGKMAKLHRSSRDPERADPVLPTAPPVNELLGEGQGGRHVEELTPLVPTHRLAIVT